MYHFISLAQQLNTFHHFLPFITPCLPGKTSRFFSKCQVLQANTQILVKQQSPQQLLGFRLFLIAGGRRRAAAGLEGWTPILHPAFRSCHPQRTHTFLLWLQRAALSTPGAQKLSHTQLPLTCYVLAS